MSTYKLFASDEGLEVNGIQLDLGAAGQFTIARAGGSNQNFARRFQKASQPYRRAIAANAMDETEANRILAQVYAETIVRGWEGVSGPDGKPLQYSIPNCVKLLTDLPELFAEIRRVSADSSVFRKNVVEAEAGNSQPASGTP